VLRASAWASADNLESDASVGVVYGFAGLPPGVYITSCQGYDSRNVAAGGPAPELAAPPDGATGQAASPAFRWYGSPGASAYGIQIATDSAFANVVADRSGMPDTLLGQFGSLQPLTAYYWRVRSIVGAIPGPWSAAWRFQTGYFPATPVLLAPPSGASQPLAPTLRWRSSALAQTYSVQVMTYDQPEHIWIRAAHASGLVDTSWKVPVLQQGTTYYWQAQGVSGAQTSDWSAYWRFTTTLLPGTPRLLSPADGSTGQSVAPTLRWHSSAYAGSYELQLALDNTFTNVVADLPGLQDTAHAFVALQPLSTYFWRVRASTTWDTSTWSSTWRFATGLQAPILRDPPDGAQNRAAPLALSWFPSPRATAYRLQLATVWDIVRTTGALADTFFIVDSLSFWTVYDWRVRALSVTDSSDWSTAWSFVTERQPSLLPPVLVSPASGSTAQPPTLTLAWHRTSGATDYRLQLATDAAFQNIFRSTGALADTFFIVDSLSLGTFYTWRVRALSATDSSGWSASWSFTTADQPPCVVYPGDTNNDGTVDARDVLPLGVYYNLTGPVRSNASLDWRGQELSQGWTPAEACYADCDGNGTVDASDLNGILLNWSGNWISGTQPHAAREADCITILQAINGAPASQGMLALRSAVLDYMRTRLGVAMSFRIELGSPNPSRGAVTFRVTTLEDLPRLTLRIYDIVGRLVRELDAEGLSVGTKELTWRGDTAGGQSAPAGAYFYAYEAGAHRGHGRVLLVR